MPNPSQLRKEILATRNSLSAPERAAKSASITKRLLGLGEIAASRSIFIYISFRSEVETLELVKSLLALGKDVAVPYTHVEEKYLDAIRITDPASQLVPGYCDIPEPSPAIRASQIIDPGQLDTIILPGSVFDERGGRFGYGGGFYDRFVSQVPGACRIGLAFDLQIVPLAPIQPHDELLDLIVTESRLIKGGRI